MNKRVGVAAALTCLLVLTACGDDESGTNVEGPTDESAAREFFEGETMTFIVPFGAGGGTDLIARAMASRVGEYLGANVVVENQPGAGGLLAANSLWAAEPDGLTAGYYSTAGLVASTLVGVEGVEFDLEDFGYLAQGGTLASVVTTGGDGGYEKIEDLVDAEGLTWGTTGPGGTDHLNATVVSWLADLDVELIPGFEGAPGTMLATIAGDVDLSVAALEQRLPSIKEEDLNGVLVIGVDPNGELPQVPREVDLELTNERQEVADTHSKFNQLGRSVLAPPGVPADRLEVLREAFEFALTDEGFQEEMTEAGLTVLYGTGDHMEMIVREALDAPQAYLDLLVASYEE